MSGGASCLRTARYCWQAPRHVQEREWTEIPLDERDVGREAGDAFVHVFERLQVREVDHEEEGLFERIGDLSRGRDDDFEELLDALGEREREIDAPPDFDRTPPQASTRGRIGEQPVGEQRVQGDDRRRVDVELVRAEDEVLDGRLVIEDHLRLDDVFALGSLAVGDELLGIEARIGVPFEARRGPGVVCLQHGRSVSDWIAPGDR